MPGSYQICIAKCIYSYRDVVFLAEVLSREERCVTRQRTAARETNRDDQAENLAKLTAEVSRFLSSGILLRKFSNV